MSIQSIEMFVLVCDECEARFAYEDEGWQAFEDIAAVKLAVTFDGTEFHGWSTDGEGKHFCDAHEPVALTPEGAAEIARTAIGPLDVPLEGLEVLAPPPIPDGLCGVGGCVFPLYHGRGADERWMALRHSWEMVA